MVQEKMLLNLYLLKAFSLSHGSNRCPIPTIDRKQKKNNIAFQETNPRQTQFTVDFSIAELTLRNKVLPLLLR